MGDLTPDEHLENARSLAQRTIIVDGHIDVPYWVDSIFEEDVAEATIGGDFDYPRAVRGGLDAAFMAIYVPASFQTAGGAKQHADHLIDIVEKIIRRAPSKFAEALTADDVRTNHDAQLVSLPMGIENGAALEDDLTNLAHFYDRGIRYITLTHAKDNSLCDASYDSSATWGGLSPFGKEVVREMSLMGLIVDVSHTSDNAFFDVLDVSEQPPVATHSSARTFTPGWERNMSDEMIRLLADKGGLVMVNFGSDFLRSEYADEAKKTRKRIESTMKRRKLDRATIEGFTYLSQRRRRSAIGTVDDVATHIEHIAELVGIEHVGLGSDFDGVFSFPSELQDVSCYPNLIAALMKRGFSSADVELICGMNFLRLWDSIQSSASR